MISADGTNTKNIKKMREKGIGLKNKVIQMLEAMPRGEYHFLIAKILVQKFGIGLLKKNYTDLNMSTKCG